MFVLLNIAITILIDSIFTVIIQMNHITNTVFINVVSKIKININQKF